MSLVMRLSVIVFLIAAGLLSGCLTYHPADTAPETLDASKDFAAERFDLTISDPQHSDTYSNETEKMVDTISFVLTNNEEFSLDCSVLLTLSGKDNSDNSSTASVKKGRVGILTPAQAKEVSLSFEMPPGDTGISVEPICART